MALILASASPRRREILRRAGWSFRSLAADLDERIRRGETARHYVLRLAQAKAEAVVARRPATRLPLLGADTTVECGGRILGKPASPRHARHMLRALSGRRHRVWTGLALLDPRLRCGWRVAVVTAVWMRRLRPEDIAAYVAGGEPLDKAGAYAIQGGAAPFVVRIEGDYDNVVGLPRNALRQLWRARAAFRSRPSQGMPKPIPGGWRWFQL